MAQLTTTNNSGTQSSTQSPQTAGAAGTTGTSSSSVQPGTAANVLTQATGGVPLGQTAVTQVNLGGKTASTVQAPKTPAAHHVNPALFTISGALIVAALVLAWWMTRVEKNTTL